MLIYRDLACGGKPCLFASLPYGKHDDVEFIQNIVDSLAKLNEISCIISFCSNIPIVSKSVVGLCNGNHSVAKHRYDEALKCLTFSDLLLVISNSAFIPRMLANLLCIAQMESVEINIINLNNT
ncbi:MAG: hypothetical protein QW348_01475 [Ignisphaera sp.]